jgi:hypothetical protein
VTPPLTFKPFVLPRDPAPSDGRARLQPLPQGTYRPQLPYRQQAVDALREDGPAPASARSSPAVSIAAGLLLLLGAGHLRTRLRHSTRTGD